MWLCLWPVSKVYGCNLQWWYLALWFVWSVSRSPWGWHICQAWRWSCRCLRGWQRWAQPAPRCTCSPVPSDACHTCRGAKGIRHVAMTTSPPHAPSVCRPYGQGSDAPDIFLAADTRLNHGGRDVYVRPWGRKWPHALADIHTKNSSRQSGLVCDRHLTEVTALTLSLVCHRWTVYVCGQSTVAPMSCLLHHSSSAHISTWK